jgi:hypothetical protein
VTGEPMASPIADGRIRCCSRTALETARVQLEIEESRGGKPSYLDLLPCKAHMAGDGPGISE